MNNRSLSKLYLSALVIFLSCSNVERSTVYDEYTGNPTTDSFIIILDQGVELEFVHLGNGIVTITDYPKSWYGTITPRLSQNGITIDEVSSGRCTIVRENAIIAINQNYPPLMKQRAREKVREDNQLLLHINATPFLATQEITIKIHQKLVQSGVNVGSVHITNPIRIVSLTVNLDFSEHSISAILDEKELLESKVHTQLSNSLLPNGESRLSLSEKDLLCDLISGHASIHLEVGYQQVDNAPAQTPTSLQRETVREFKKQVLETHLSALRHFAPSSLQERNYLTLIIWDRNYLSLSKNLTPSLANSLDSFLKLYDSYQGHFYENDLDSWVNALIPPGEQKRAKVILKHAPQTGE